MFLNGAPADLFDVASNPDSCRERHGDTHRIPVSSSDRDRSRYSCAASEVLREIYRPLTDGSLLPALRSVCGSRAHEVVQPAHLIATSTKSAEIIKHASMPSSPPRSRSSMPSLYLRSVGADVKEVCEGIGSDSRIGNRFSTPVWAIAAESSQGSEGLSARRS